MAINVALTEILACPLCKGKLKYDKTAQRLICLADGLAYPVRNNIPVLIADEAEQLSPDEVKKWRS
ncbi:Trm112 family protein [Arsukibacterium perlucidum]|uniref:Trm112 family protein n=1 Tax=Arsukibacterium perlucidum TaxID=368811 RepID=UPI0003638B79